MSDVFEIAKSTINDSSYRQGATTCYEIFTIKNHNHHYLVIVRDNGVSFVEQESFARLDAAKKLGVQLLTESRTDATTSNTSMYHYKADRSSGNPWVKDMLSVLEGLFRTIKLDPLQSIQLDKLHKYLKAFTLYRLENEEEYQDNEKRYKIEFLQALGHILRRIDDHPGDARMQLMDLIKKKQSESVLIRWWDNLISAYNGYSQRDDFHIFLENCDDVEFTEILSTLVEEGITADIRTRLGDRFKSLFEQGRMAPNKKSASTPTIQFLAVILAAYSPEEYSLYKSTEYTNFALQIGLQPENDAISKYHLFNEMNKFILNFAREHHYNVEDLIDVHNLIYLHGIIEIESMDFSKEGEHTLMIKPQNLILYGPPGTGKTYNVINEALKIVAPDLDPDILSNPNRRQDAVDLYKKLIDSNQIMFCTFHQSYSYEDFVEGIRFSKETNGYEVRDGVFKRICSAARASKTEQKRTYDFNAEDTRFFKMSLGNINDTEDDIFNYCIDNNVVALGWGDDVDFTNCTNKEDIKNAYTNKYPDRNSFAIDAIERFKHWMRVGDIVVISSGNRMVRAIGKITGDYKYDPTVNESYMQFREVEWLVVDATNMIPVERILKEKKFSQQSIYRFYEDDLNLESLRELIAGKRRAGGKESQYVLIIDEINRGNISKIFGELITLIEPDKRLGQPNELTVTLPYSEAERAKFSVPSNVHIIGTMNTADRSIALLDTALRRRFVFKEMMPDYDLLPTNVEGINIRKLLQTINDRIEYLYDRDHQIGHAYFIVEHPTAQAYKEVMVNKVIPLLQEYFYENWESIELVLGGASKKSGNLDYLLSKTKLTRHVVFGKISDQTYEQDKYRYTVNLDPSHQALIRIYEKSAAESNLDVEQDELE